MAPGISRTVLFRAGVSVATMSVFFALATGEVALLTGSTLVAAFLAQSGFDHLARSESVAR